MLVATLGTAVAQGTDDPAAGAPPPPPAPAPAPAMTLAPTPPPAPPLGVAQPAPPKPSVAKNAIYGELAGAGGFYTLNYERFLMDDASIRVGLMYMQISVSASSGQSSAESKGTWMAVPIMFEYTGIRAGAHALNLGGGLDFMYFSGQASTFKATASSSGIMPMFAGDIGYRYSSPSGGFLFKATYTPLVFVTAENVSFKDKIQHWAGLSFGWRFGT